MTTTITTQNERLNKIANVLNKAKGDRALIINDVIAVVVNEAKEHKSMFATKKLAQKWIVENMLEDAKANEVNGYIKRALYVAKAILIDGYTIKKEWLSIAQAEKAVRCDKGVINASMALDDEETYIDSIKESIALRDTLRALTVLDDADAVGMFEALKKAHGEDTRKILNAMLKVL